MRRRRPRSRERARRRSLRRSSPAQCAILPRPPMGVHRAILLIAVASAAVTSWYFFPFTVDDAFIVARYAVNARDLGEWAFNAGERVSAMTSPLHGILMVALSFVAADPIRPYKFVALALAGTASVMALLRFGVFRREAM